MHTATLTLLPPTISSSPSFLDALAATRNLGERPVLHWRDLRSVNTAYDLIGDVHSCGDELGELLELLGYRITWAQEHGERVACITPPAGRKVILLGDLLDRGPKAADTLRIAMAIVAQDCGYILMGNHDFLFTIGILGSPQPIHADAAQTISQLAHESAQFFWNLRDMFSDLPTYLWLDEGRLCVSHAGLRADLLGSSSAEAHNHAIYGNEPARNATRTYDPKLHWAASYTGETTMAYGHFRLQDALWVNNTICLDTACVYGGKLSALRWPERDIVSVPAHAQYTKAPLRGRCIPPGTSLFY